LKHVPYGQSSPFTDLLGGHIDMIFDALIPTIENIKAGRLRALAVTGSQRLPALPELPTFAEVGLPAYTPYGVAGLLASKGTPEPIVSRMQEAIATVLRDPEPRRLWESQGCVLVVNSPAEFAAVIRTESERWGRIIAANNIRVE
jgi:tripartite-type tricarboxylate transporter receptor subunit TctC